MGSPSKIKITLLGLLVVAVLLFAVFKLRPDILGPIGGGVTAIQKPSPEIAGNPPARDGQETGSATQGSTRPEPGDERQPVVVAAKIASGEVISYGHGELLLRLQSGKKVKFSVTENTRVAPELKSGKKVSVQYREDDGQNIALWVQPAGPQILAGDR